MLSRHIKLRIKHNVTLHNGFSLLNLWLLLIWPADGHEVRRGNDSIVEFKLHCSPAAPQGKTIASLKTKELHALGFTRAVSDAELLPIYRWESAACMHACNCHGVRWLAVSNLPPWPTRANLDPDLEPWEQRTQEHHGPFTLTDLTRQARKLLGSPYIGILVVRNGQATVYTAWRVEDFALNRMTRMRDALTQLHLEDGGAVPDTVMIFNSEDEPICHRFNGCQASVR